MVRKCVNGVSCTRLQSNDDFKFELKLSPALQAAAAAAVVPLLLLLLLSLSLSLSPSLLPVPLGCVEFMFHELRRTNSCQRLNIMRTKLRVKVRKTCKSILVEV